MRSLCILFYMFYLYIFKIVHILIISMNNTVCINVHCVFLLLFIMQYTIRNVFVLTCNYVHMSLVWFVQYHNTCTQFCIITINLVIILLLFCTIIIIVLIFFVFLSSSLQVISNHTRSWYFYVNHCCALTYAKQSSVVSVHYVSCTWIFTP